MKFVIRPLLIPGMLVKAPDGDWVMLVDSDLPQEELAVTIWHEFVHLFKERAGDPQPHNEVEVEALGQRLAKAFPEIVELIRPRAVSYDEAMLAGRPFMRILAGPNDPMASMLIKFDRALKMAPPR